MIIRTTEIQIKLKMTESNDSDAIVDNVEL